MKNMGIKRIEDFIYNKRKLFLLIFDIFLVMFMYFRAFWGLGLQDESYYVSLTISQMDGNLPFAYDNYMWTQGSGFLMMPLIVIYRFLVHSNTGLFLFLRLCYVTFRMLVIWGVYTVIRKELSVCKSLLVVSVLIPNSLDQCIQMFSYNNVYFYLSLLTAAIIYDVIRNKPNYSILRLVFAGFLSGVFVFAHEIAAVVVICFGVLIFVNVDKFSRWRMLLAYCLGGIVEILIVMLPIVMQAGTKAVINGFYEKLFFQKNYGWTRHGNSMTLFERILESAEGMMVFVPLFVFVMILVVQFTKRHIKVDEKSMDSDETMLCALGLGVLATLIYAVDRFDRFFFFSWVGGICVIFVIGAFLFVKDRQLSFSLFAVYPICFVVAEVVFANTGGGLERLCFASVLIMLVVWMLLRKNNSLLTLVAIGVSLIMILGNSYHNIKVIHSDQFVSKLTTFVETGIYKGILTTKERASIFPQMEEYVTSFLDEGDTFAFKDQVPFGPLLAEKGKLVDSRPWDYFDYASGGNNPIAAYHYYQMRGEFPTKIYYLDWNIWDLDGLSIDHPEYLYNKWVNTYYELVGEEEFGPVNDKYNNMINFKIKVYSYIGGFDGNYQKWIDEAAKDIENLQ